MKQAKDNNNHDDRSLLVSFAGVEDVPVLRGSVAYVADSSRVFRESTDIMPVRLSDKITYMPWGADNLMPYKIIGLIEGDETLATCQMFNAELCYGAGLEYNAQAAKADVQAEVEDYLADNDIPSYFLGVCQDFKHFAFAVSVIILNADNTRIVRIQRKEACYCRFAEADESGHTPYVYYANWREPLVTEEMVEVIPLLSPNASLAHLRELARKYPQRHKYAIVSRIPTPDSTYYPIPYYAALFKGKWYNIKQLIGVAKESKLKNSAPLKYQIEISSSYFANIMKREGITDRKKQQERIKREKQQIIDFITGAENSGKILFSEFYITPTGEQTSEVRITKIDSSKEGGDWESDIQEAMNMMCFAMKLHSNLIGSVPGKAQSNNSGSDKRELYTIAQALQKPYHDILFAPHRLIAAYNGWRGVRPECPFIQLTTLDEGADAKRVQVPTNNPD